MGVNRISGRLLRGVYAAGALRRRLVGWERLEWLFCSEVGVGGTGGSG